MNVFALRSCRGKRLYIVDLGCDAVYVMDLERNAVRSFGTHGKGPAQFWDPAGIAVDKKGYMVVADSRNHRLQVGQIF